MRKLSLYNDAFLTQMRQQMDPLADQAVAAMYQHPAGGHFRETIGRAGLEFEYRRLPGPATTRTAIALLEATGAAEEVLRFARRRAEEIEGRTGLGA